MSNSTSWRIMCVASVMVVAFVVLQMRDQSIGEEQSALKAQDNAPTTAPFKSEGGCSSRSGFQFKQPVPPYEEFKGIEKVDLSNEDYKVPNIVHYIWYSNGSVPFRFHHMLSVLSAHRFIKPEAIYLYTNSTPTGEYWKTVKESVPELKIIFQSPSVCLFGEPIKSPHYDTSACNVDRLVALLKLGGIYLDFDVLVVRSFDPLRRYSFTIGLEMDNRVCGGIVISSNRSGLLMLWANTFLDDYRPRVWAYNSGIVPLRLSKRFPHLVHVEKKTLHRPNYREMESLWGKKAYPWQENYSVHLWYRMWIKRKDLYHGKDPDYASIRKGNSTFDQIARHILD